MSLKERCSNPLMSIIIFLVILIVALITAVIMLRMDNKPIVVEVPQAFQAPKSPESVTSSTPKSRKSTASNGSVPDSGPQIKIVTSRPIILTEKPRNVCETPECITVAHQLHNWHDPSVDPCQDFYKFSCGKYMEHTVVEGSRASKKEIIVDSLLKEHLVSNEPTDVKSEKILNSLYQKCLEIQEDLEKLDENTEQAMKDVLEDINFIGSWPLADEKWDEKKFDLNDMLANIAKLGVTSNGLFVFGTPNFPTLEVAPIYNREPPGKTLKKAIEKILEDNGIKFKQSTLDEDYKLYQNLEKTIGTHELDTDAEMMDFDVLQKAIPSIDLKRIIENMSNPKRKSVPGKILKEAFGRNVSLYFGKNGLEAIIKETPKRVLANYLIFYYIDVSKYSLSSKEQTINDRQCEHIATDKLPEAALALFVKHHFDRENIQKVSDLVDETKESFIEMVKESKWLHEDTKRNAILKIQKMKKMVGYPEEFEEKGSVEKLHEDLNIEPTDSYYRMSSRIEKFRTELLMDYASGESKHDPGSSLLETNAMYTPNTNHLEVLVPFIDDPFFDTTFPKYAKIAITGNTLAHEIAHGFDPEGRQMDEEGYRKDWWTPEDTNEYEKRTQCLVKQYNNYDDPDFGKKLNGNVTIHEMVADGLGVETSWRSLKKLDLSKEPKFVGLENEPIEKVYFRIAALDFCSARDTEDLASALEREHPTSSFRVNGVFSNMKQFAETYNCPVGSPMNPKNKCELF